MSNGPLAELDYSALRAGRVSPGDFAAGMRRGIEETGMVALRGFVEQGEQKNYAREFSASSASMKPSSGTKYSLKYEEVAHHEIVRRASSPELLGIVNEVLRVDPAICPTLLPSDVKVGYSITSHAGDSVPFHFDHLCVLNILVPVVLPESDEQEPATLSVWPNVLGFGTDLGQRLRMKAVLVASRGALARTLPLVEYRYRAGEALAFFGSRSLHGVFARSRDGARAVASFNYRRPPNR